MAVEKTYQVSAMCLSWWFTEENVAKRFPLTCLVQDLYAEQTLRTNGVATAVCVIVLSNLHVHIVPNICLQEVQIKLENLLEIENI